MEYTGQLITGDFEENTMTFEIEGEMKLQAGRYKIVRIEAENQVKNIGVLADVVGQSEQLHILDRCECEEPNEEPIKVCMNCNGYVE